VRCKNQIIDLVITYSNSFAVHSTDCCLSDYFRVFKKVINQTQLPPQTFHSFRRLHCINTAYFRNDSRLIAHPPKSLGSPIAYNATISSLLAKHASIITIFTRRQSNSNPSFTSTLCAFRYTVHHPENLWKRTHSALVWFLCVTNTIISSHDLRNSTPT